MRMDKTQKLSAYDIVNNYPLEKLVEIFFVYGEEVNAKSIAKKIVTKRVEKPIENTLELVEIIRESVPISYRNNHHPARKVFQAIRIEVNNELGILEESIRNAFDLLDKGGRLSIITFHSLEDRIVKNIFKELSSDDAGTKNLPVVPDNMKAKAILINKKPIIPSKDELEENNRSRSAKLRILEKI
jgi:16S rRNA (cytosine1402-N4)-methyltransferase